MTSDSEPRPKETFDSMREVAARLRALKSEALIDLYEIDQAVDEVRRSAETLLRAAQHAHANIRQLASMGLLGEVMAGALSRNSQAVLSAAEQLRSAMTVVRVALDFWVLVEAPEVKAPIC